MKRLGKNSSPVIELSKTQIDLKRLNYVTNKLSYPNPYKVLNPTIGGANERVSD